jgi:hypothetical protein
MFFVKTPTKPYPCSFSPPQRRHPERSAARIYRITDGLWRGVEGPRRGLLSDVPPSFPTATPTVSAHGSSDAIVWLVRWQGWNSSDRPAVLYAYDAADVTRELYDSGQNPARDRAGLSLRFNIPTVVNGHVYVGTKHQVDVYGLLPAR